MDGYIRKNRAVEKCIALLIVLCFFSCKDLRYEEDAGTVTVTQDGSAWDAEVTSLFDRRTPDVFAFNIFESLDNVSENKATNDLRFRNLPFETGTYELKYTRDFSDQEVPQVSLNHQILRGVESVGQSAPWEAHPQQLFEITHVSKNSKEIEGKFTLSFISQSPEITQYYALPDTTYLEGTFMIDVRS